jgi:hypothetical protein
MDTALCVREGDASEGASEHRVVRSLAELRSDPW